MHFVIQNVKKPLDSSRSQNYSVALNMQSKHILHDSTEDSVKEVANLFMVLSLSQYSLDVFMSQNFIGNPIKDVKHQEAHGKNSSGDGINPFGPIHKTPPYLIETQTRR